MILLDSDVMISQHMALDLDIIENMYDTVAKEYAERFSGEHEKKPKDREILFRFSKEIRDGSPV